MANELLVEVSHVAKSFGDRIAVHDVHFNLQRGDVLGLLGPNGAGKSTSLGMITGNLAPSAGFVKICGSNLADAPLAAKRELGYLPEQPPLYKEMSVQEYLQFCARLHQLRATAIKESVDEAMSLCGLLDVRGRVIGNLSKGFQQRVGIAQAIIHRPAIVVLDEPTVGLDPNQMADVRSLIRSLGQRHAIILSSHILSEIEAICNRVLIMHRGQQVWLGGMADVATDNAEFLLRTGNPVDPNYLRELEGIASCIAEDEYSLRVTLTNPHDGLDIIFQASLKNNWRLREVSPLRNSLEQLFVDVTCGKTTSDEVRVP